LKKIVFNVLFSFFVAITLIGCSNNGPADKQVRLSEKVYLRGEKWVVFDNEDAIDAPGIISCSGWKYQIVDYDTGEILRCIDEPFRKAFLTGCWKGHINPIMCGVLYKRHSVTYLTR